jgi:hypothetical protein
MTSNSQAQDDADGVLVAKPVKGLPLRPARKQVNPGEVVKSQPVQTGKEYSEWTVTATHSDLQRSFTDIWYNKWAGGDREDSYSK